MNKIWEDHKRKDQPQKETQTIKRAVNHFFNACGYLYDFMLCKKIVLKLKTLNVKFKVGQIHENRK